MKYPKCTLGGIVSPGQYNLVSNDRHHRSEVELLEVSMTNEMNELNSTENFALTPQMCVGVRHTETGYLKRGVIERRVNNNVYEVFLIDYGCTVKSKKDQIKVITNKDFMELEPLAFTLVLYGVLPSRTSPMTGVKKISSSMDWLPNAKDFVARLFEEGPEISVKVILLKGRTAYGDLYIKEKQKCSYVSLRKLLHKHDYCAFSETHFLRLEGLDVSSETVTSEKKMELVENWWKKNFGSTSNSESNVEDSPPLVSSVVDVLQESNILKDSEWKDAGGSSGSSGALGKGRGHLRKLISEKKTKAALTDVCSPGSVQNIQPQLVNGGPRKVGIGRGELLRRYLDGSLNSTKTGTPFNLSSVPGMSSNEESFFDVDLKSERNCLEKSVSQTSEKIDEVFPEEEGVISDQLTADKAITTEELSAEEAISSVCLSMKEINQHMKSDSENENETKMESKSDVELKRNLPSGKILEDDGLRPKLAAMSDFWVPLVKFSDSMIEPVNTFRVLPIQPSIIWNLEKGGSFNELSQIQRWAIPAIRKQHNTVIIGGPKTGKTFSYVIPLMDYIQDESFFDELPDGNGAAVVIVASSCHVCESIYYLCQSLLRSFDSQRHANNKVNVVLAHGGGREEEVWVDLTNGCDVLITTPHCLVRLLKMPVLTNFERLTCLVLDDIDVVAQKPFLNSIRTILEKAKFSTKERHYQKILCGEKWTPGVENLVQAYVKSHALVIGSFLEAVVYNRLKPSIALVEREKKPNTVLSRLKEKLGKAKVLVYCRSPSEAIFLKNVIAEAGITSLVAHEELMAEDLREIGNIWNNSQAHGVLILTDEVLSELNIKETHALIHYSLPLRSKTNFYLRYSPFLKYFGDDYTQGDAQNKKKKRVSLSDVILIDEENHFQLPHIVDFIVRLGGKLPHKIIKKCEEIRRLMEVGKVHSPVCDNLLAFGRCRNFRVCPRRHAFVKTLDSPDNVPTKGWVNFTVIKVHNASYFSARLIECVDTEGNAYKVSGGSPEMGLRLSEFYKTEDNRRPHGLAKMGDVCAIKTEILEKEVFLRAEVVEYLKLNKHEEPVEVSIRLLDEGGFRKWKSTELYELPEELRQYPSTAIDVRLVGVQPLDFDISWNKVANNFVESLVTRKLEENQYWSGKIVLSLRNTLFLEPVKRKQFLPVLNTQVFDLVLQEELLNRQMAVTNKEHLPALLRLCAGEKIEVPTKEEIKRDDGAKIEPQWAFFDQDFLRVRFLAAEHTSRVFLEPNKFHKLLKDLEADCQKEGEKTEEEIKRKKGKNHAHLSVGSFCLARFEDGRWNRARIEAVDEDQFYVFFVDHGDFLHIPKVDVIPISQTLLLRLPCQAIECRLAGIKDGEECPLEVLQEIYRFSDDGAETLYAYITSKDLKPEITNGRKYNLNLLNTRGISLNKWLVDEKLVAAEDSEKGLLEDIEVQVSEEEKEDEEEWISEDELEEEVLKEEDNPEMTREQQPKELVPFLQDSSQDCFNFTDDVFDNEEAQAFLKEFASKLFPSLVLPEASGKKESKEKSTSAVKREETPKKITAGVDKKKRLMDLYKKRLKKVKRKVELKGREEVFTPRVLWSQNQLEVYLKILLGNVEDYTTECTSSNFSFRCILGEKFYSVDFKLYGVINPQMTICTPKAFHVLVTLTKLAFPLWPRLQQDEGKVWWINLDVESLEEKDRPFADKIKSVKRAIETGRLKKAVRGDTICAYTDSEDSDGCSDSGSECSDYDY